MLDQRNIDVCRRNFFIHKALVKDLDIPEDSISHSSDYTDIIIFKNGKIRSFSVLNVREPSLKLFREEVKLI